MPSDDPAREIARTPLAILAFMLKLTASLKVIPYLYGLLFALNPLLFAVDLILFGVWFVVLGLVGFSQLIFEGSDFLIGIFPQFSIGARVGLYLGLIVVGSAMFLLGKKIYLPAKALTSRSLSRLRELYREHGANGFAWIFSEMRRVIGKLH